MATEQADELFNHHRPALIHDFFCGIPTIHWMSPEDLKYSSMSFKLGDPIGIDSQYPAPAVAMVDGSVQRLSEDMTPDQLRAMCTANGDDEGTEQNHMQEMQDGRRRPLKKSQ